MKLKNNLFLIIFITIALLFSLNLYSNATTDGDWEYTYDEEQNGNVLLKYLGSKKEVYVPKELGNKNVVTLGEGVFQDCTQISKVVLPETVTHICNFAFVDCSSLKHIIFETSDTITYDEGTIFRGCKDNLRVSFSKKAKSSSFTNYLERNNIGVKIYDYIEKHFAYQKTEDGIQVLKYFGENKVAKVPNKLCDCTVTQLGPLTFKDCTHIKKVILPENITRIYEKTFKNCTSLEKIIFNSNEKLDYISGKEFSDCPNNLTIFLSANNKELMKRLEEKEIRYFVLPGSTTSLKVINKNSNSITLSWDKNNVDVYSYNIYYYDYIYKRWFLAEETSKTTYKIDNLNPATKYKFRVRASKAFCGENFYGKYSDTIKMCTTPKKAKIKKSSYTVFNNKLKLQWAKQKGASGYKIYVSTNPNGNYKKIKTLYSEDNTKFSYTKLPKGKKYYIKVRAFKSLNGIHIYGPYSDYIVFDIPE